MKRPFNAAEAAALTTTVSSPDFRTLVDLTMARIHSACVSGIFGTEVNAHTNEDATYLHSFLVRLGYQCVRDKNIVSIYWTSLRQ